MILITRKQMAVISPFSEETLHFYASKEEQGFPEPVNRLGQIQLYNLFDYVEWFNVAPRKWEPLDYEACAKTLEERYDLNIVATERRGK